MKGIHGGTGRGEAEVATREFLEACVGSIQRRRTCLGLSVIMVALISTGCGAVDENPLNVNGDRSSTAPTTTPDAGGSNAAGSESSASTQESSSNGALVGDQWGDDPLGIAKDGATLCGVQPETSLQQYTLLLHNPTLETFTFSDIGLGSPEGLSVVSVEVTPANKEGHGNHGAAPGAAPHAEHEAVPSPTETEPEPEEPSTFEVEPVPAEGFVFESDAHIDIVVKVALDDEVDRGTAENVTVDFSSPTREYSAAHPLNITVDRTSCS